MDQGRMVSVDPTILIIMGEIILALILVIVVILVVFIKRKRNDKHAIEFLQGRLHNNAVKRQEWFEHVLANVVQNEDRRENKRMAINWVKKENQFYSRIVEMYVHRKSDVLRDLDVSLHDCISSFIELVSIMRAQVDKQKAIFDEIKKESEKTGEEYEKINNAYEKLKEDNDRISKELSIANSEIMQTMREYSMAFRAGDAVADDMQQREVEKAAPQQAKNSVQDAPKKIKDEPKGGNADHQSQSDVIELSGEGDIVLNGPGSEKDEELSLEDKVFSGAAEKDLLPDSGEKVEDEEKK